MIASEKYVRALIDEAYPVDTVTAFREVPSEADLTAIVETTSETVVVKTTADAFGRWSLTVQAEAQLQLQRERELAKLIPTALPNVDGDYLTVDGPATTMLMTFQEGTSISDVELTDKLIAEVARMEHQSARRYANFLPSVDMKAYPRPWDLGTFRAEDYQLELYLEPDILKLAEEIFADVAKVNERPHAGSPYTAPQFIFGDFNLSNVLCADGAVSGLIDFGDATVGTQLADIAIALCYLQLHPRGLSSAELWDLYLTELAKHQDPPTSAELEDLARLVRGRALMILLNGRQVALAEPNRSEYALRYDAGAVALLLS